MNASERRGIDAGRECVRHEIAKQRLVHGPDGVEIGKRRAADYARLFPLGRTDSTPSEDLINGMGREKAARYLGARGVNGRAWAASCEAYDRGFLQGMKDELAP